MNHVTKVLEENGIDFRIFSEIGADPTLKLYHKKEQRQCVNTILM